MPTAVLLDGTALSTTALEAMRQLSPTVKGPSTLAPAPIITLLPFALVGAIGSLAVLDYLGFGLPAGSASWGELLNQAQTFRKAWWLILYPSLALFTVMLLGVFIGEGLRDALDPRPYSKLS